MHVFQFLHVLALGEDVEVVVTRLPEGPFPALNRDGKLEGLNCLGRDRPLRFADQQMYVFGHYDIAENIKVVADADCFE